MNVFPAYKHIILCPEIDPTAGITQASGHYDSMYGTIESGWEILADGSLSYRCRIPANTTATLTLPASPAAITEGDAKLDKAGGISDITTTSQSTTMTLAPGTYSFIAKM